jgi:hypothetical protein
MQLTGVVVALTALVAAVYGLVEAAGRMGPSTASSASAEDSVMTSAETGDRQAANILRPPNHQGSSAANIPAPPPSGPAPAANVVGPAPPSTSFMQNAGVSPPGTPPSMSCEQAVQGREPVADQLAARLTELRASCAIITPSTPDCAQFAFSHAEDFQVPAVVSPQLAQEIFHRTWTNALATVTQARQRGCLAPG